MRYASSSNTNKLAKSNKKLSPAMFAFAKANKAKLKNPTPAQKKIFAQYDAMVKAGNTPANPKPRPSAPKAATPKKQTPSRPNQTKNGASLGSKLSAEEKAKRKKAASPASMAAADKRKKAVDGVGPSDAQRRKDSSAEAMKPKQYKGGGRSRPTGNRRVRATLSIPKKKKNRGSRNRFNR